MHVILKLISVICKHIRLSKSLSNNYCIYCIVCFIVYKMCNELSIQPSYILENFHNSHETTYHCRIHLRISNLVLFNLFQKLKFSMYRYKRLCNNILQQNLLKLINNIQCYTAHVIYRFISQYIEIHNEETLQKL